MSATDVPGEEGLPRFCSPRHWKRPVCVWVLLVLLSALSGGEERQAVSRDELAAIASRVEPLLMARWTAADKGGYERNRSRLRSELANDFVGNGITSEMLMALLSHDYVATNDPLGLTELNVPYLAADALPVMMLGGEQAVGSWLWKTVLSKDARKYERELAINVMSSGQDHGLRISATAYTNAHFSDMLTEFREAFEREELSTEVKMTLLEDFLPLGLIRRGYEHVLTPMMKSDKERVSLEDCVDWVRGQGGIEGLRLDDKTMADVAALDEAVRWASAWAAKHHPQEASGIIARLTVRGRLPLSHVVRERMGDILPVEKERSGRP